MGNGMMLENIPNFSTPPQRSDPGERLFRVAHQSIIRKHVFYRVIARAMPDWWNNVRAVRRIHAPLLVIHSETDRVNPVADGREIYAAANQPKSLVFSFPVHSDSSSYP